ncbi:MAG: NYN domain-containing protein [bacterium]
MQPGYLVDGYNVIHREPGLAALLGRDAESARERLISLLAGFRAGRRVRVTVVFDGQGGAGQGAHTAAAGVQVLYARAGETADERIVRLVRNSKHPRSLTVVSSDRGLVNQCRDFGAGSVGADEFLASLRAEASGTGPARSPRGGPGAEKPEMRPGDAADWEEYFRQGGMDLDRKDGLW